MAIDELADQGAPKDGSSQKLLIAGSSRPKFSGQTEYPLSYGSKRDIILVMPSGSTQIEAYDSRIRETESGTEVFCKHFCEWKPASGFDLGNGKFKSTCKACHSSRYSKAAGYESPTAKAVNGSRQQTCNPADVLLLQSSKARQTNDPAGNVVACGQHVLLQMCISGVGR